MRTLYAIQLEKLPTGQMKRVVVNDTPILLFNYEEQVYALSDKCPHLGASLSKGTFAKGAVTCAKHQARIDIRTGEILGKAKMLFLKVPTKKAEGYPVKIEDGKIFVEL